MLGGSFIECDTDGDVDEYGGALYLKDINLEVIISGTSFIRNRCYDGGCYFINTAIKFFHCTFKENIATNHGSCIVWDGKKLVTILHSYFDINSASGNGGAIYCSNTSSTNMKIELCIFHNNKAKLGNDIYLSQTGTISLSDVIKSSRSCSDISRIKSGGSITDESSVLPVVHTQIYVNVSDGVDDVFCGWNRVYNETVDWSDGKPCKTV
jgi:predicted outer membrane repeat protein